MTPLRWYRVNSCELCNGKGFVFTEKKGKEECPLCCGRGELKVYSKEKQ